MNIFYKSIWTMAFGMCIGNLISNFNIYKDINIIESDIQESRHREDLLLQEVKNLDYIISILTSTK